MTTTLHERATKAAPPAGDQDAAARLRAIVGKLSRRLTAASRGSGFTQTQVSVLGVIARSGPIQLSELAEVEGLNQTMLSRVIAALESQRLVRRRTSTEDRRVVYVETTATGRKTHERLRHERGRVLASALDTLSPGERAAIEAALPALEALVEAAR